MKFLFDFFPIVLFFIVYKIFGIYAATFVAIIASIAQVSFSWFKHRRFESMQIVTLALIVLLGGATLILHDDLFIKWKPTAVYWALALFFFVSQFFEKSITQRMMEANVELPKHAWSKLNLSWVGFFLILGGANVYVLYHFSTDAWVNFKLFGMLGLTVLFVLLQALYLLRFIKDAPPKKS